MTGGAQDPQATLRGRLVVVDIFFIAGRGIVATGKVENAPLQLGDAVVIHRAGRPSLSSRIQGLDMFRHGLQGAPVGINVGVRLADVAKGELQCGDVIQVV